MIERAYLFCGAPSTGACFPWSYTPNESRAAVSVDVDFLGTRHLFRNPMYICGRIVVNCFHVGRVQSVAFAGGACEGFGRYIRPLDSSNPNSLNE